MSKLHRIREYEGFSLPGIPILIAVPVVAFAFTVLAVSVLPVELAGIFLALTMGGVLFTLVGLFNVQPNEARVLTLFGAYRGTIRKDGMRWTNPFYAKARRVSVRVRNFESGRLKVNDLDGNPVEIAAVVVWQVDDTAEAVFQVDNFSHFVQVQSEAALRNLAMHYPYDNAAHEGVSLRSHPEELALKLRSEIQARLESAGVKVLEARLSHLAYASEIARAMLQRQQAKAVVDARETIVDGAVSMVEGALDQLARRSIVELDPVSRAKLASNLLVVLCADNPAQPIIETSA